MKIKLSETIPARERDAELRDVWDEDAMRRVRDRVLERAGLAPRLAGRRRAGRRAAIVLAALLTVMLAFATALATTDLGVMVADMFRDYGGPKEVLDALGVYGGAVGCKDTQDGLTVRVEAAFAGEAESMVALSFEDAQGRLGEGMDFNPWLVGGNGSSYFSPEQLPDGKMSALVTFPTDQSMSGKNVELIIDDIMPQERSFSFQRTGLTLGEAIKKPMPFPVPGVPEARFADIRMEDGGLVISVEWPSKGLLQFHQTTLRKPSGETVNNDRHQMHYNSESVSRSDYGFEGADLEALADCELMVYYAIESPLLDGIWKLKFQMPRGAEKRTEMPINEQITIGDMVYSVDNAVIYPTCVVVNFSQPDDQPSEKWESSDAESIFADLNPEPQFGLLDGNGRVIAALGSTNYVDQRDGVTHYQTVLHCLTEKQDTLTLNARDESGKVLRSYKLK
ncbi:MAG: hypothetical protein VB067_12025 [Christensenellaceae bacterium]|nr:hypothetical protein [Christensenellaceae bacterium]MEA5069711.1 hypothetical protein [Christensenellaceae bacterium]